MNRAQRASALAAAALALLAGEAGAAGMSWSDLLSRPRPHADATLAYGRDPSQVVDVWKPAGGGVHPVVVMIHGGCWTAKVASRHIMNWAAADLRSRGVAVWNIEYRRLGQAGGGYPGTYLDVGAALDRLRDEAPRLGFSLRRIVVVGHSAGGHLALWAAARRKLPASSVLRVADPLRIDGVVDIAGIPDLKTDAATACGAKPLRAMAGASSAGRRDVYADTSPAHLLPLGAPQVVIHGTEDRTVPLALGQAYATRARAAGDAVAVRAPPGGHVEEISPGTPAWATAVAAAQEWLK